MLLRFLALIVLLSATSKEALHAQSIAPADLRVLRAREDSLARLARKLITDTSTVDRLRSDSVFIRTLVRTLSARHSFKYPLDSLKGISRIYAPDSSFRIITWSLPISDYYHRQRGAIQMRTPDGRLKLIPLSDHSEFTSKALDSVRGPNHWIGAVYYNIIKTEWKGKLFYTLFGFDNHGVQSNKKWIDVLTFNAQGLPQFGEAKFTFENDSVRRAAQHRFAIEYKEDASTLVNWVPDEKIILVDHLISETDEDHLPHTFIPDGDHEGFRWVGGRWQHIEKVFDFKLQDGEAPLPTPIQSEGEGDEEAPKPPALKRPVRKKN